jgi:L-alanine-DL-glutamate epimerase-like enolase superfamily enzyme
MPVEPAHALPGVCALEYSRIAADESVQVLADIPSPVGRYDVINIKLDRCGGLTEGLAMAREARRLSLGVMVGSLPSIRLLKAQQELVGLKADRWVEHTFGVIIGLVCKN